jgi:hypothetical protein
MFLHARLLVMIRDFVLGLISIADWEEENERQNRPESNAISVMKGS